MIRGLKEELLLTSFQLDNGSILIRLAQPYEELISVFILVLDLSNPIAVCFVSVQKYIVRHIK